MSEHIYTLLSLCRSNSTLSILAEAILRREGGRHFRAFSAGSQAKWASNPYAITTLTSLPLDSIDRFSLGTRLRNIGRVAGATFHEEKVS